MLTHTQSLGLLAKIQKGTATPEELVELGRFAVDAAGFLEFAPGALLMFTTYVERVRPPNMDHATSEPRMVKREG